MAEKIMFAQLSKVDSFLGIVTGTMACAEVDYDNEILDYEGSKPYFRAWSDSQLAISQGKSYGNVRLQHDEKKPIGILTMPPVYDDEAKCIKVTAQIIDPVAKDLLRAGVLTGFSIGGDYIKKTPLGNGVTQYIAGPSEVSACDRPCSPSATFSSVKADGTIELKKFRSKEEPPVKHFLTLVKSYGFDRALMIASKTPGAVSRLMNNDVLVQLNRANRIAKRRRLIEWGETA